MRNRLIALALAAFAADTVYAQLKTGDTVEVTAESVNLSLGTQVKATARQGDQMKVLKVRGTWIGVELNGKRGWVKSSTVKKVTPAPGPITETTASSNGAIWPQLRGPGRDGKSSESGLMKRWPDGGPPHLWTTKGMGDGYGSMAIVDNTIFLGGRVNNQATVTAVFTDGKKKWGTAIGSGYGSGMPGSRGTPTYDKGKLYYMSPNGNLACLDAASGRQLWNRNMLQEYGGRQITWGLSESMLVFDDKVICYPGGRGGVVALNKSTGREIWTCGSVGQKPGYASPILVNHGGLTQVVTMTEGAAVGIHASTGKLLWKYAHPTAHGATAPTPIFEKGHLFISSGYGKGSVLLKLNASRTSASVSKVWETTDLDNHHGGVVWIDGYLYGSAHKSHGSQWICLDARTGNLKYAERGVGKGSLLYADGMLFLFNEGSRVGLAKATPSGLTLTGQFRLPRGGRGQSWAYPVVVGGRMYLRHGDALHAFKVK
ncbi:MAG: PQQ-like beta-propeller repeat protein [Planctomycetota bacterium]|jgi:outer membrane protein assembly factor BamB|nr:PQQ-like beta-propeller repeat protein [Planctomycetota bacterium]